MSDEVLYIVMPAYNEEANIENTIRVWYPIVADKAALSRLVVADAGSTDGTHDILLGLKEELTKLEILEHTEKQHGPKVIALYDHAIKQNADYVFQTDSDGQTDPAEFDGFWNERDVFDGLFGNRVARGDGKDRAFVEKVVCVLLSIYFGVDVPDANAPFRLMRTSVLKKYLYKLPRDYNIPNIVITAFFVRFHERVKFVDISFGPRQGGKNSIDIRKIIKIGIKALLDFKMFRNDMKSQKD